MTGPDVREGVAAVREKRPPKFTYSAASPCWRSHASSSCSTFRRCSSLNSKPARRRLCLGGIVVLYRGLEMLADRDRLSQLPPQPAEEAHLRGFHGSGSTRRADAGFPRRWRHTAGPRRARSARPRGRDR